jgi:hypothetical protein
MSQEKGQTWTLEQVIDAVARQLTYFSWSEALEAAGLSE